MLNFIVQSDVREHQFYLVSHKPATRTANRELDSYTEEKAVQPLGPTKRVCRIRTLEIYYSQSTDLDSCGRLTPCLSVPPFRSQ